ncbi:MAG TPA: MBL fold metallo-hydrolase, partial [Nitrolancea sp.]|nr:MBL fold metallo-hydrolase [Nitrolancea sp.]
MFFEQIVRQDIGCAAYIVGSNDAGAAAVVDPRIDMTGEILELLAREGLRLRYIVETHNHADHVAGHHELRARTGAEIAVHAAAGVDYPHRALRHGDELALGEVRLRVIHTPGHRPEHIALAVLDTSRAAEPWLVLTGDSLFIGDVARPDLAIDGREGAGALFHSLHQGLLELPEGTLVFPGHVAGSLCGRVNNRMTGTTIGFERRHNPALTITDEPAFVAYMTQSLPQRPPNMARIVRLNQSAEPLAQPALRLLSLDQLEPLRQDGATLLDVRSAAAFAAGHLPGSFSVDLHGGQFQNRVGLAVPLDRPLVLVAETEADAEAAARALAVIGVERIAGGLVGPPETASLGLTPEITA